MDYYEWSSVDAVVGGFFEWIVLLVIIIYIPLFYLPNQLIMGLDIHLLRFYKKLKFNPNNLHFLRIKWINF